MSETKDELKHILTYFNWDKIEPIADILSGKTLIKEYEPAQVLSLLEKAKLEFRKMEAMKNNQIKPNTFEDHAKIRDVENGFIEESFKLVILMKLVRLYTNK